MTNVTGSQERPLASTPSAGSRMSRKSNIGSGNNMVIAPVSRSRTLLDQMASRNQQGSPLLRLLPPELRNIIYRYVLRGLKWVVLPVLRQSFFHSHPDALALLYVCRQIHAEAALLPFALNMFLIGPIQLSLGDQGFLRQRSPTELASIQHLHFLYDDSPHSAVKGFKFPDMLPRIKKLQIQFGGLNVIALVEGEEIRLTTHSWARGMDNERKHNSLEEIFRAWKPQAKITMEQKTRFSEMDWEL